MQLKWIFLKDSAEEGFSQNSGRFCVSMCALVYTGRSQMCWSSCHEYNRSMRGAIRRLSGDPFDGPCASLSILLHLFSFIRFGGLSYVPYQSMAV